MKKLIFTLAGIALFANAVSALNVSFEGSSQRVLNITPEKSTGLDMVYIVYDASQLNSMRITNFTDQINVSRYSNLGGGYAEEVNVDYEGSDAVVDNPQGDMGYIISDSKNTTYLWVVNYLPYMFQLNSIYASDVQNCDNTTLEIDGSGAAIHYYTIDGRQVELNRDIEISYNNLVWDQSADSFEQNRQTRILNHLSSSIQITPPLFCNSTFTIKGDKFLEEWGRTVVIESPLVYANGVDAETIARQLNEPDDEENSSNVIHSETQGMGGSAPVEIEFRAFTTDAVIHNEWQIASDSEFEYIDYRFNEQNFDYSFTEEGTYYVRFVGSNSDGSCEVYGETYTIGVGSSELRIPNAFTPNGDGVNDEWKVAYRSLLSFQCSIFDRYGNELFHFDDPSLGWDGKYKGKYVNPGVYFYVIEAIGADGKKYKKGGDINIIKSKKYNNNDNGGSSVAPIDPD